MKSTVIVVGSAMVLALLMHMAGSGSGSGESPTAQVARAQWNSAHAEYKAGRFESATGKLRDYVDADPEFRERSRVWRCILLTGMSRAYLELAAVFQEGARRSPGQADLFAVYALKCRRLAHGYSQELRQLVNTRRQWLGRSDHVVLDFDLSGGGSDGSLSLVPISQGKWPGEQQAKIVIQNMVGQRVLEETMKVTHARSATELASQLSHGPFSVPIAQFFAAVPYSDQR